MEDEAYDAGWDAAITRSEQVGPGLAEHSSPSPPDWVVSGDVLDDWGDGYHDGIQQARRNAKGA